MSAIHHWRAGADRLNAEVECRALALTAQELLRRMQ